VTQAHDKHVGTTVGGKYLITEVIGRGGMGVVCRAIHRDLGEPVAVKFLHPIFSSDHELRARFRREAVALARLRHPSIVALLDVSGEDEEPFMVMELVDGNSLEQAFESSPGTISLPRLGEIFSPLLEVLEMAHGRGIVHRDVKPSNVMLLAGDHVKLLDFGLVHLPGKDIEKLTQSGMVHGTPDYMSPEQCQGDPIGPPTDVYATGIMLFEALAGQLPFEAKGAAALMAAHLFLEPPSVAERSLGRVISAPLEALVQSTLAKSAAERPTALELRHTLTSILRGTDAGTLAEQAGRERVRLAALSRGERAFTGSQIEPPAVPAEGSRTRVLLWVGDQTRAASIRMALAVSGIVALVESGDTITPEASDGVVAVLVLHGECERHHRFAQAAAAFPSVPLVVLDVAGADATPAVIRAGASDMTLQGAPDSDLARRIARIARRGR